jgi:hypothetical protein
MKIIDRIMKRASKVNGSDKTRAHIESLIMAAYEAGRADMKADIMINLTDDMLTEQHLDHLGALDMIRNN